MNFKNLLSLRKALQDSRLYTEAMNVNYLIKCAAVDPIATNKTTETDVPDGFFSPEDIAPENYMKKLWQLYYKDIRTFNFDNFVKSLMREGKSEAEAKELAEQKVIKQVDKSTKKTMESHGEFISKLREMKLDPSRGVVSPGSGAGHEQMMAPDINWLGLEYQSNLVNVSNQRNEQVGIPSRSREWSLTKGNPGDTLGEDWKEKINEVVDENGNIEAMYAKHACGGLTDGAMYDAVNKGVPKMLLATCCANRYTELSWRVLHPKDNSGNPMSFEDYKKIANKSKAQDDSGKDAVDKIDSWREEYLKNHGYEVERGRTNFGPYIKAIRKS
jgi:hypothetical protein